jgi:integrase
MGRYTRRSIQFGEWFLYQRHGSTAYYRARYNRDTGKLERFSLGTIDAEDARQKLETWWLQNRQVREEGPADASLADILRRYWEHHAQNLPSASGNRDALAKWLDYWQDASVAGLTVERQDAFVAHLEKRGLKRSTIQRTLNIGRAAISRAFKRGELASMPFILSVTVKTHPPKGRPLEIQEIARLYHNAAPHLRTFILWMAGTAARPEAIINLRSEQVEWQHRVIRLNPEGREQNKKHRPVVRLPETLACQTFDGWLITHRGDHVQGIKTAWKAAVKRAGLDNSVRPYSLRHTAARWMRLHGVSADEVAQQLGHRKLGSTGVYTEYDPQYLKAACEALDQLTCQILASAGELKAAKSLRSLVLPEGIELSTSPLPRECSTTELRQLAIDLSEFSVRGRVHSGKVLESTACSSPSRATQAALRYSGSYSV